MTNNVKHSSLLWYGINYARKKFFDTGSNVIKLFTVVSYACSEYARVFVPGMPVQPSLMLDGKAGAYPRVELLK